MQCMLGDFPSSFHNSRKEIYFFKKNGMLKCFHSMEPKNLRGLVTSKISNGQQFELIFPLLMKMLNYDVSHRISSKELVIFFNK